MTTETTSASATRMAAATARRVSAAPSGEGENATDLLDPNHLVHQAELGQDPALALGILTVEEAPVADHVLHGVSRLGGDANDVALGAQALRKGDREPERNGVADPHRERLALADHHRTGEALLAERGDEGLGVPGGREV